MLADATHAAAAAATDLDVAHVERRHKDALRAEQAPGERLDGRDAAQERRQLSPQPRAARERPSAASAAHAPVRAARATRRAAARRRRRAARAGACDCASTSAARQTASRASARAPR